MRSFLTFESCKNFFFQLNNFQILILMKNIQILLLFAVFLAFAACGKDSNEGKTIKLLLSEKGNFTQTINGVGVDVEIRNDVYQYDSQNRIISDIFTVSDIATNVLLRTSIYEWTHLPNKMLLKCITDSIDYEYTIIDGLVTQRLDKLTNRRKEFEYDSQNHIVKTIRYDNLGAISSTQFFIYNSDGNLTDKTVAGSSTKYEYATETLAISNATYGVPMFGESTKNAPSREVSTDPTGMVYSDFKYTYETDSQGFIVKRTRTDALNPSSQPEVIEYTYK
jgi:hypothetical protein